MVLGENVFNLLCFLDGRRERNYVDVDVGGREGENRG